MHHFAIALLMLSVASLSIARQVDVDADAAEGFARLALECVHREYPNKIAHVMHSDADAKPPRTLTPAFFGCYDWHSAVHAHWLLARVARVAPAAPIAVEARKALARSLTHERLSQELAYLQTEGRTSFERPYGLAWLLQLATELQTWDDAQARGWAATLAPLATEAAARFKRWLPNLRYPIREGEHDQTAFSFGLAWDWAQAAGDADMQRLLREKAAQFYLKDEACPLAYEPSGQDFLSPCLAEADFMRRILQSAAYAPWLANFLPQIARDGTTAWLRPAEVTDRSDPKLAHLDGLNLSRAFMLQGIARGLPDKDPRIAALRAVSKAHRGASLAAVTSEHYVGSHWLGTFALYGATH